MSLLTYKTLVDYEAQQSKLHMNNNVCASTYDLSDAFEDFLRTFKSTTSADTADALGDLNLGEDDLEDDYDFMEATGGAQAQDQQRTNKSKIKYMNLMQQVADRTISNLTIELDDLDTVSSRAIHFHHHSLNKNSTRRLWEMQEPT